MLRQYFIRRLRLHYVVMIIPTVILFLVVGVIMVNLEQRSLQDKSRASLVSIDESMDESLYNMGTQIDSMMTNASFSLSLKKTLSSKEMKPGESLVFSMVKYFFRSYRISYTYINSIYLYIDGGDRFLSTAAGNVTSTQGYFDGGWLDEYQEMSPDVQTHICSRWIQRNSFEDPVEVISLFYRLTYVDGVVVINVDKNEYRRFLRNLMLEDRQQILLFNAEGESIAVLQEETAGETPAALTDLLSGRIREGAVDSVTDQWKRAGGLYYLDGWYSEDMNMFLFSACPLKMLSSRLAAFLWIAAIVLLLEMVVMLVLAYRYTRQSFDFIEQYIDIFSAAERGEYSEKPVIEENNEYGMILNNIIYMYLQHNRMQMELQEKEHLKTLAEMASLQMQINPHFIFNTLQIMDIDVIRELGVQSPVHRMIQRLSSVVKYALSDPMEEVTIRTEIDYLKAYLDIQNVRFNNRGIIYFEVDESTLEMHVFRLMLQPVLENCFSHGMRPDEGRILIKVKIYDRGDHLFVSVTDNGRGMKREDLAELVEQIGSASARSIGLVNLNRRLILHYGEESALHILSRENEGTVIYSRIPKDKLTSGDDPEK